MKCAKYAADTGRRFVATYGATGDDVAHGLSAAGARAGKMRGIGVAMRGIAFDQGDQGREQDRRIVYKGPNVTLGYAERSADTAGRTRRRLRDRRPRVAGRSCHYIVGRKKRFLKLYGYRIGLDETELPRKKRAGRFMRHRQRQENVDLRHEKGIERDVVRFVSEGRPSRRSGSFL